LVRSFAPLRWIAAPAKRARNDSEEVGVMTVRALGRLMAFYKVGQILHIAFGARFMFCIPGSGRLCGSLCALSLMMGWQ
jgi:hypothetical protein